MNTAPADSAEASDFAGQVSNVDPGDCPDGAMVLQVNLMCIKPGQLTTRGGLKLVTLDELE